MKYSWNPNLYVKLIGEDVQTIEGDGLPYSDRGETEYYLKKVRAFVINKEVPSKKYRDYTESFELSWDPKPGKDVFVLIERYDTGDTFGRDHNQATCRGVYKTYKAAQKASVDMQPIDGYFDRFIEWQIERVMVELET